MESRVPNPIPFLVSESNKNSISSLIKECFGAKFPDISNKKQIIFYIRNYILYIIQYILCKYVNETKVAVETAKHDVIDNNNYSLILPLETVILLANAYAAKIAKIGNQHSAASSQQPKKKVATVSRKVKKTDSVIGLQGFSPVALTSNEKWKKGLKQFMPS